MADFTGGPGFLAFVFTFSLAVAGVLLFRSLSKHLRKVKGASSTSSDLSGNSAAASATSASIADATDASSGTAAKPDAASSPSSDADGDASGGDGD